MDQDQLWRWLSHEAWTYLASNKSLVLWEKHASLDNQNRLKTGIFDQNLQISDLLCNVFHPIIVLLLRKHQSVSLDSLFSSCTPAAFKEALEYWVSDLSTKSA